MDAEARSTTIAVIIATTGRPDVVSAAVRRLVQTQTFAPSHILISCVSASDAGDLHDLAGVKIILGPKGLPAQRNTALGHLAADTDIVAFFDDDFIADPNWLAAAVQAFASDPRVTGFTGRVLADGIKGPGLSFDDAVAIVAQDASALSWKIREPFSPYGCNMAFRCAGIGASRFDERLVLYGWLEDRDFAAGLAKRGGRFIKCAAAKGVHMGTKRGRIAGDQLGYSQVINPLYLLSKGTMTPLQVADHILRNVISNIVLSLRPEAFVDRRGRLRGNLIALQDVLRGRLEPERAATLKRQSAV